MTGLDTVNIVQCVDAASMTCTTTVQRHWVGDVIVTSSHAPVAAVARRPNLSMTGYRLTSSSASTRPHCGLTFALFCLASLLRAGL